jgi:carbamoyltransferase
MIILGINYFFHDSSACIIRDGELVIALEEERFSRQKHTYAFPERAIQKCLEFANIRAADVDHIAVSIKPRKHAFKKIIYGLQLGVKVGPFLAHELSGTLLKQKRLNNWYKNFSVKKPPLHFIEHHLSHIAGSYYISPYDKAALLSIDGSGEWSTLFSGVANGLEITKFSETMFPHSLGSFYEAATEFCGFKPNYDEGKTMGLAPMGNPERFYAEVEKMVQVTATGQIELDLSYFAFQNSGKRRCSDKFYAVFGQPRKQNHREPFGQHHLDIAAAFQRVLEEKVLQLANMLYTKTKADYIVLAGGVALNSVMNGRIVRETPFKDAYIMPAAGDNGTSIGAAYYVYHHILGAKERSYHNSPYVGNEYSNEQVESVLKESKLKYRKSANICQEAARMLREGNILGWFQGRMEIGPRALGNRSILADPSLPGMKDKINAEVKHREAYRPFAPSVLAEARLDFFKSEVEAPFMLKVCDVREDKKDIIPAITHVDGSARIQTVRKDTNPRYHELLSEFGRLSGVPVLLNTSFNIMGEPIVESPVDALRCFFTTGLDVLVINDFIIEK